MKFFEMDMEKNYTNPRVMLSVLYNALEHGDKEGTAKILKNIGEHKEALGSDMIMDLRNTVMTAI